MTGSGVVACEAARLGYALRVARRAAPASMMAPARMRHEHWPVVRLGLEAGLAERGEERGYLLDPVLGARKRVMTGDGPLDVVGE